MAELELSDVERATLDAPIADLNRALADLFHLSQACQNKRGEIARLTELCRATLPTILRLRGLDPNDYEGEVDLAGHVNIRLKTRQLSPVP